MKRGFALLLFFGSSQLFTGEGKALDVEIEAEKEGAEKLNVSKILRELREAYTAKRDNLVEQARLRAELAAAKAMPEECFGDDEDDALVPVGNL